MDKFTVIISLLTYLPMLKVLIIRLVANNTIKEKGRII